MPSIILEFFCGGSAIFDCGTEQKYQINSQLCRRPADHAAPFLFRCKAIGKPAKLEGFDSSDFRCIKGGTEMEVVCDDWTDGGELGS